MTKERANLTKAREVARANKTEVRAAARAKAKTGLGAKPRTLCDQAYLLKLSTRKSATVLLPTNQYACTTSPTITVV